PGGGGGGEPIEERAAFVVFQIDCEAALVAVEGGKEAGGETDAPPGRIALRRLDLDYIGAEIGENQACARPHDRVTEFEYADAGEGEGRGILLHVSACPRRVTAGLDPAVHAEHSLVYRRVKDCCGFGESAWIAGSSPAMT